MLDSLRVRLLLTLVLTVAVAVGTVALLASQVSASELQRFMQRDMERNQLLFDTLATSYDEGSGLKDAKQTVQRLSRELGERIVVVDDGGVVLADSAGQLVGATLPCDSQIAAMVVTVGASHCSVAQNGRLEAFVQPLPESGQPDVILFGVGVSDTMKLRLSNVQTNAARPVLSGSAPTRFSYEPEVAIGAEPAEGQLVTVGAAAVNITRLETASADPIVAGFTSTVNRSVLLAALAGGALAVVMTALLSRSVLGPVEALTSAARRMGAGDLRQRVAVQARGEIGELALAFNSMAEGLERQEELRRHMVTDVAHELRTPLTNIRGYLEALRDGVARPDAQVIESLHEEALLLNRLVDDLQDLSLAEAGQLRLHRRQGAVGPIVERAVAAAAPLAAEKCIRLDLTILAGLPEADVDPERIGQVLRNLLTNAITHTPTGGTISVRVGVADVPDGGAPGPMRRIRIDVADTGSGISPEHLPHVFERFFRADPSRSRATGGAGIGLTIVRRLVEAHGGEAWAASQPCEGATFSFTLPAVL
jgi:signal transduction histidine kinase